MGVGSNDAPRPTERDTMTPTKFKVSPMTASELDILHEMIGDAFGADDPRLRLVSQWDGRYVIVYDREHAAALAAVAVDWANDIDRDIDGGMFGRNPETKRHTRAIMNGLYGRSAKLHRA